MCTKTTEKNKKEQFPLNNGKMEINAKISTKCSSYICPASFKSSFKVHQSYVDNVPVTFLLRLVLHLRQKNLLFLSIYFFGYIWKNATETLNQGKTTLSVAFTNFSSVTFKFGSNIHW